mmetsp:Transcript_59681/g.140542  ORF Transcript_59681/g.140542 Transcript_59681/m.140542 type:complete len:80 (+) Transcript_59681:272-511(+)
MGQPSFNEVVAAMERLDCLDREEAEALVVTMRRKLAEAKLMEEEVIGLRLHTGPAFMKLNETLRERDVGKGNKCHRGVS